MNEKLTTRQTEIINGCLLGDGSISRRKRGNLYFAESHSSKQKGLCDYLFNELGEFSGNVYYRSDTNAYMFYTKKCPLWNEIRQRWYPDGKKTVPSDLVLTPLTVAWWYFGDGCRGADKGGTNISTQSFASTEVDLLRTQLKDKFGIETTRRGTEARPLIGIRMISVNRLFDLIRSSTSVPFCMEYKLSRMSDGRQKYHKIMSPDGKIHEFFNISQFCRENNLDNSAVHKVLKRKVKHHLGWTALC